MRRNSNKSIALVPAAGCAEESGPIRGKGRSVSKADLKGSQLPVTVSAPYVCAQIPAGLFPDMLPVLDEMGGFMFWADETLARSLVAKHQVEICRTTNKIRALKATCRITDLADQKPSSHGALFGVPHKRETDENVYRVWTLERMGWANDKKAQWCRKVCKEVLTSCIKAA